jgi:hypothetical protein
VGNLPKPNQTSGPLTDHVRRGRVYKSPLAATGALSIANWLKDDLPDLLWPALVLAERGNNGIRQFVKWQAAVQANLAHHDDSEWVAETLDGRLTHLATLAERYPDASAIVVDAANRRGLLSEEVRRALASYPYLPARWLVGDDEVAPPQQADLEFLREAVLGVMKDGHRQALLKCFRTWSTVQAGTFRSSPETVDLLKDYPGEPSKRPAADSVVRAMWGAHRAMVEIGEPHHFDRAIEWAQMFWGTNSMTSKCIRKREIEDAQETSVEPSEIGVPLERKAEPTPMPEGGEDLRRFTMDLLSSFVEALETAPANLYASTRQEVVSGLVARAGRDVIAVLGAPDLWCLEHSAHIGRMLVEVKIYLHWMAQQDPSIYRQFQEYGAGKAKLYSRISNELPNEARTAGFRESIDELKRLSHNDDVIDHRIVDTRDTFADGKSIRVMAEEAGLLDFYRQAYSLASGVTHSEWWSVETHAMEPCLNVLHGMHLTPSLSLNYGGNVELANAWVDQFYSLVRTSFRILGTDEDAVEAAFAWMGDDEGDEEALA